MPLQVISEALGLPDAVTRLNEPSWAFAQTLNLGTSTGLLAWHSKIVRDTDPMFSDVKAMMQRSCVERILRVEYEDPMSMFGQLDGFVYLLHPKDVVSEPSRAQKLFTDIFAYWGDPVPVDKIGEKIYSRSLRVMNC